MASMEGVVGLEPNVDIVIFAHDDVVYPLKRYTLPRNYVVHDPEQIIPLNQNQPPLFEMAHSFFYNDKEAKELKIVLSCPDEDIQTVTKMAVDRVFEYLNIRKGVLAKKMRYSSEDCEWTEFDYPHCPSYCSDPYECNPARSVVEWLEKVWKNYNADGCFEEWLYLLSTANFLGMDHLLWCLASFQGCKLFLKTTDEVEYILQKNIRKCCKQKLELKPRLVLEGTCENKCCAMFGDRITFNVGFGVFFYSKLPYFRCINPTCDQFVEPDQFKFHQCYWNLNIDAKEDTWKLYSEHVLNDIKLYTNSCSLIIRAQEGIDIFKCAKNNNSKDPIIIKTAPHSQLEMISRKIYLRFGDDCAICLESLCDRKFVILECGHVFHDKCSEEYKKISDKCAFCRK